MIGPPQLIDVERAAMLKLCIYVDRSGCDQARSEEYREAGSEEQLLKEVRDAYNGKVVAGHDREIF